MKKLNTILEKKLDKVNTSLKNKIPAHGLKLDTVLKYISDIDSANKQNFYNILETDGYLKCRDTLVFITSKNSLNILPTYVYKATNEYKLHKNSKTNLTLNKWGIVLIALSLVVTLIAAVFAYIK